MAKSNVQGTNRLMLCPAEAHRLLTDAINRERTSAGEIEVTRVEIESKNFCESVVLTYKAKGGDEGQR